MHLLKKDKRTELLEYFDFGTDEENGKIHARGIYIIFDGKRATRESAFYFGVANDVPKRLANHLSSASHKQSSLFYRLMKRHRLPDAV